MTASRKLAHDKFFHKKADEFSTDALGELFSIILIVDRQKKINVNSEAFYFIP